MQHLVTIPQVLIAPSAEQKIRNGTAGDPPLPSIHLNAKRDEFNNLSTVRHCPYYTTKRKRRKNLPIFIFQYLQHLNQL